MKKLYALLGSVLLVFSAFSSSAQAQITYLKPQNVGMTGDIPSGYRDLVFTVENGNWASPIKLPTFGDRREGDKIKIHSSAQWTSVVWQRASDIPLATLNLATGQSLSYKYSASTRTWVADVPTFSGSASGGPIMVTLGSNRIVRVKLLASQSASKVVLPATASDDALVLMSSASTSSTVVDTANMVYAYRAPLRSGADYAYQFKTQLNNKWLILKGGENRWGPSDLLAGGVMPGLTAPTTRFNVPAGSTLASVTLPGTAYDRDRVIFTSAANDRIQIRGTPANTGTQTLGKNQTYEWIWDASVGTGNKWKALQVPNTMLRAGDLTGGTMPPVTTPLTTVEATDASMTALVQLPSSYATGDKVVVKSAASTQFQVNGIGLTSPEIMTSGEEVEFRATTQGWTKYTNTIRLLLLASQGVVQAQGADVVATRQLEAIRLSNEALANSNANFRYQKAGSVTIAPFGSGDLGRALSSMRSSTTVASLRKTNSADVVYYDGQETGSCGLAYVNAFPANSKNMYAAGNFTCGTTVMRHELGHTMGLSHGNGFIDTIMSGNKVPYFAIPNTIYAPLGVPMNLNATVADEVNLMNKNGPRVSAFHQSLP